MSEPPTVEVFGESRGNPGLAGAGAMMTDLRGREVGHIARYLGVRTTVQAEFHAIACGLELAITNRATAITVLTSHDAPFRQLTGKSAAHIPEVLALYAHIQDLMITFTTCELRLVPSEDLDSAERLAAVAIDSRGRRQAIDYGV